MSSNNGDDFKSFQIGNMGRPGMGVGMPRPSTPAATPAPAAAPAAQTGAGGPKAPEERIFPVLEELLEADIEAVQEMVDRMNATCASLDELIEKRTGRAKDLAQKARIGYDRTFDLIEHLMEVKSSMLSGG